MGVVTMKSQEARNHWRNILDIAHTGGRVIIERHSEPQAILINYEQWQMTQRRLLEFELLQEIRHIKAKGEPTIGHDELKRLMIEKRTQEASGNVGD